MRDTCMALHPSRNWRASGLQLNLHAPCMRIVELGIQIPATRDLLFALRSRHRTLRFRRTSHPCTPPPNIRLARQ